MDALDIQNAAMQGVAAYYEWRQKFMQAWTQGAQLGQLKIAFAMMPAEMKDMLKKSDPEGYARVTALLKGGSNG